MKERLLSAKPALTGLGSLNHITPITLWSERRVYQSSYERDLPAGRIFVRAQAQCRSNFRCVVEGRVRLFMADQMKEKSVLSIKAESADLSMSKHSTAATNQKKNAVWTKKIRRYYTSTRGARGGLQQAGYDWGGVWGRGEGRGLSE